MKARWRVWADAAVAIGVAAIALWFSRGRFVQGENSFRVQSSFVLCDSSVTTSTDGKMLLPQCRGATGTYQDLAIIVSDGLKPLLIGGRTDKYMQVMTIDEEGTSKIEKFGHWLSRGRYCRIILDGETKQWFHPLW